MFGAAVPVKKPAGSSVGIIRQLIELNLVQLVASMIASATSFLKLRVVENLKAAPVLCLARRSAIATASISMLNGPDSIECY